MDEQQRQGIEEEYLYFLECMERHPTHPLPGPYHFPELNQLRAQDDATVLAAFAYMRQAAGPAFETSVTGLGVFVDAIGYRFSAGSHPGTAQEILNRLVARGQLRARHNGCIWLYRL